jgi:hypothetical protein
MDFQPHPVFPSLWLIGPRVGAGGPETVLTALCKGTFRANDPGATPLAAQEPIRVTDEALDADGNLRHEHDLAPTKPHADVVVVGSPAPPAGAPGAPFWTERVALGGRTLARIFLAADSAEPLTFGWVTRTENPRLALAGTDLEHFDPATALLPDDFDDRFHNGGLPPTSGGADFEPPTAGSTIVVATAAGTAEDVSQLHLPAAYPRATLTRLNACDCPVDEDLPLRADTMVYDKASGRFTVVWRGARPLDPARLARFPRLRLRGGG